MKIGRNTIIRAILALGAAGTIAGSVATPAVTAVSAAPAPVSVAAAPGSWYHG